MYNIGKAINGISLNGLEWLLDDENNPMEFDSKESAIEFLKLNGYDSLTDEEIEDTFTFKEIN